MFVSTSEFLGVLSVLAHVVCRLAGALATCQIMLKTPILRTDDPSSQHTLRRDCPVGKIRKMQAEEQRDLLETESVSVSKLLEQLVPTLR